MNGHFISPFSLKAEFNHTLRIFAQIRGLPLKSALHQLLDKDLKECKINFAAILSKVVHKWFDFIQIIWFAHLEMKLFTND